MTKKYFSAKGHFTTKASEPSVVFPIFVSPYGARSYILEDEGKIWWEAHEIHDWSFLRTATGPSFMTNFEEASEYISKNWEKFMALADLEGKYFILNQKDLQVEVNKRKRMVLYCPKELNPICTVGSEDEYLPEKEVTEYIIGVCVRGNSLI